MSASASSSSAYMTNWPTPDAMNRVRDEETLAKCAAFRKRNAGQNTVPLYLAEVAQAWPTPSARDWKGANDELHDRGSKGAPLNEVAKVWPTPRTGDGMAGQLRENVTDPRARLEDVVSMWSTPTAHDGRRPGADIHSTQGNNLSRDAALWTTPSAGDGQRGGTITAAMSGTSLTQQVNTLWMTPRANENDESPEAFHARRQRMSPADRMGPNGTLTLQAKQWPTPTSLSFGESHQPGNSRSYNLTMGMASTLVSSLPDRPISTVGDESSHIRRTLNPLFVEWLMGWPPGWTSLALTPPASSGCACSATALSAWKARMRSALCAIALPVEAPPAQLALFG
nr:hypothetical protein [Mesorhizobium sp.]